MPNWIQVALLSISYGICSPFWTVSTLPSDIMYAKLSGASFYEVRVLSVDSLRTVKRFWTGDVYSRETRDSTSKSFPMFHLSYLCQFEVVGNLAGKPHSKAVPLVAVDSRGSAESMWKRAWPEAKRNGKTFILILEKNGQVRAFYLAESELNGQDEFVQRRRMAASKEMVELLRNEEYKGYIHSGNLVKLFKREGFDVDWITNLKNAWRN